MMRGIACVLAVLGIPGCYLAHERDAPVEACGDDVIDAAIARHPATRPSDDAVTFVIESQTMFPIAHGARLLVVGTRGSALLRPTFL